MISGAVTVLVWQRLDFELYEIVPGFLINLIAAVIVSRLTYKHNEEIEKEFDESLRLLRE